MNTNRWGGIPLADVTASRIGSLALTTVVQMLGTAAVRTGSAMSDHHGVQMIARHAMDVVKREMRAGQTLSEVRELCERSMRALGADSFWYWGIGAFVFGGEDTTQSVSGRDYRTADRVVRADDIVTLDLSPQHNGLWGDFARTLILENGRALDDPRLTSNDDWRAGILAEESLHADLRDIAEPSMTLGELYIAMNSRIRDLGFENLDFLNNLGHSIERRSDDRLYIEHGNNTRLGDLDLFTFEPHIRRPGGTVGFKHENIYYFENARLTEL
jgi:methionine aminopeptidase